ncbi:MAG: hypothetical protein NT067_05265 [Candidatus Diapherotrites archaeon]|nr:hypothetical protein [Candidatus Diapherotrites archaeon]
MFELEFEEAWDKHFAKLDKTEQERIWKKIQQLKALEKARHLKHGLPFFVLETGQYRVCFSEENKTRTILFAGNHKQYEKWLKQQ